MNTSLSTLRLFTLALYQAPGFGPAAMRKLLEKYNSIEQLYLSFSDKSLEVPINLNDGENLLNEIKERNLNFICCWEQNFPDGLQDIPDAPIVLFYLGDLTQMDVNRCISIVGSRDTSEQALLIAQQVGGILASRGYTLISGMAIGIDSAAHRAALEHNSQTIAVLASPPDVPTPVTNTQLHHKILTNGGMVISEYIQEDMQPGRFVLRNRIIAALSKATIVVQAREGSGALHTAKMAKKYGRKVLTMSGSFGDDKYLGNNYLMNSGIAKAVNNIEQLLSELDEPVEINAQDLSGLDDSQIAVLESLRGKPKLLEELAVDMPGVHILSLITVLEMQGLITKLSDGRFMLQSIPKVNSL